MATLAPPAPVAEDTSAPTESKKGRKRLVVVLLAVVIVAAALFVGRPMLLGSGSDATAKPGKPEPGPIVSLEPMTLNLADGHFLKLGLALQLTKEAGAEAGPSEGESASPAVDGAPAQDAAITVLGERTYAALLAPGGRTRAQQALQKEVDTRYEHKVMRVYFTEFVMQ